MEVIFVNRFFHPDHSATSQLLSDLAFKCVEWDYEVKVVTSRQRYDDPSVRLPEHEQVRGVDVFRVSGTHFGRRWGPGRFVDYVSFLYGARKKLKGLVGRNTIVVAKTDPPMLGAFLPYLVYSRGGVLMNWLQDVFPETVSTLYPHRVVRLALAPLRRRRNRCLNRAVVNVVIGRRMKDYLLSEGVRYSRLRVIPNWGYDDSLGEVNERDFRAEWGLEDRFVVGYFGNLGLAHEYETILGAMMATVSDPRIVFLFVGGGALLDRLKNEAGKHGLTNFVQRDYVAREDLPAALQAADVHLVVLQPALEGLIVPSKFAGALAAGRPVLYVGDRKGEIGRQVRRRECGQAIDTGDSQGLTDAIRTLAADPAAVAAQGEAATNVYRRYYRPSVVFRQWRLLLNTVADKAF